MKRMVCIGAQSIDAADITARLPVVEKLCRRDGGPAQLRTYLSVRPVDVHPCALAQLPLFDEIPAQASSGN